MSDAKEPTAPEATKAAARSRKYLGWAVLFIGFGVGLLWRELMHDVLFRLWQPMYGHLPDALFFRMEIFFDQPNGFAQLSVSWLFFLAGLLGMLYLTRGKRRWYENLLLVFVVVFMFLFLQPCLCAPHGLVENAYCLSSLETKYRELQESGGDLPDQIPLEWQKSQQYDHEVIYHGKGRSLSEEGERFVILEDAPRSHVGDLRHRLWSDGKVESWYPWKEEKK
jgi:hypothetical protein